MHVSSEGLDFVVDVHQHQTGEYSRDTLESSHDQMSAGSASCSHHPIFLILPNHAQQHDQFSGLVKSGKGRFGDDFVDVVQLEDRITNLIGVC